MNVRTAEHRAGTSEGAGFKGCPLAALTGRLAGPVLWGVKGGALLFVLTGLKCIILYVVLPAVAVGWVTFRPSADPAKESTHAAHASPVPASCPFRPRPEPDNGAALGPVEVGNAGAAR